MIIDDFNLLRDRIQKEIVFEAIIHKSESEGLYLTKPLDLGIINFWESIELITLSGVDTNTGVLFDTQNRIIRYQDIPTIHLMKIHNLIVNRKCYK